MSDKTYNEIANRLLALKRSGGGAAIIDFKFHAPADVEWLLREVKKLRRKLADQKQGDLSDSKEAPIK